MEKIVFENSPSTNTPLNAANLNLMQEYIRDGIYPIGSIYLSVNDVNPSTYFGGTWEQIKDTFLLSAGDTYEAGSTGGEAEHTLTIDEMPKHDHDRSAGSNISASGNTIMVGWRGDVSEGTTIKTWTTGKDKPHNNMPPYLTVYMWKRIS